MQKLQTSSHAGPKPSVHRLEQPAAQLEPRPTFSAATSLQKAALPLRALRTGRHGVPLQKGLACGAGAKPRLPRRSEDHPSQCIAGATRLPGTAMPVAPAPASVMCTQHPSFSRSVQRPRLLQDVLERSGQVPPRSAARYFSSLQRSMRRSLSRVFSMGDIAPVRLRALRISAADLTELVAKSPRTPTRWQRAGEVRTRTAPA